MLLLIQRKHGCQRGFRSVTRWPPLRAAVPFVFPDSKPSCAPMKLPSRVASFVHGLITCAAAICLALFAPGVILAAGPSVAALVATCDRGLAQGNTGVDAAACEWFAVPCECRGGHTNAKMPPWCIPKSEAIEQTVRKVVAELRRYPDPTAGVESVVPAILARIYPCQPSRSE